LAPEGPRAPSRWRPRWRGARSITVVNRDPGRGGELVALIDTRTPAHAELVVWDRPYQVPEDTNVVMNATSIGLFPDVDGRLEIVADSLLPHMIVADVIPNPPRTALIRDAEARGCVALDGLGMLVNQGVISIELWTGVVADPAVMRQKVDSLFSPTKLPKGAGEC